MVAWVKLKLRIGIPILINYSNTQYRLGLKQFHREVGFDIFFQGGLNIFFWKVSLETVLKPRT